MRRCGRASPPRISARASRISSRNAPRASPDGDALLALQRELGADGATLQHVTVLARQAVSQREAVPALGQRGGCELGTERRQLNDILGQRARSEEERAAGGGGDAPRLVARRLVIDERRPVDGEA